MTNVIYIDFHNKVQVRSLVDSELESFIEMLMQCNIDEDDIQEVIDAIYNPTIYNESDDDIQLFADAYLAVNG
jgi:hypothetical protein